MCADPRLRLSFLDHRLWYTSHSLRFYHALQIQTVKISLEQFDKAFENRLRLQIMSVLVANESYDFNSLKDLLAATDGNLASHLKALEKEEYITVIKTFIGRKPNTQYMVSKKGRDAFLKHLEALENLIKHQKT